MDAPSAHISETDRQTDRHILPAPARPQQYNLRQVVVHAPELLCPSSIPSASASTVSSRLVSFLSLSTAAGRSAIRYQSDRRTGQDGTEQDRTRIPDLLARSSNSRSSRPRRRAVAASWWFGIGGCFDLCFGDVGAWVRCGVVRETVCLRGVRVGCSRVAVPRHRHSLARSPAVNHQRW